MCIVYATNSNYNVVNVEVDDDDDREDGSEYDNEMTNYNASTTSSREHNDGMT